MSRLVVKTNGKTSACCSGGLGFIRLSDARVLLARRVGLLAVDRVAERRLDRLVVRGHRAVDQALRHVERALPVALHDERVHALDAAHPVAALGCAVGRRLGHLEVGDVVAGPLPASPGSGSHQT